jgi:peptidoglycan/xylan/chitin deacetylase (PgdA/CDA1 family)
MFHGLTAAMPAYATFTGGRTCLIRAQDFERVVKWCKRNRRMLRLSEMPDYLTESSPDPAVLLTFDDGLASLTDIAVPILKRHGLSACVFVTTGWVDGASTPAVFRLEREIWERVPDVVAIDLGGGRQMSARVGSRSRCGEAMAQIWSSLFSTRVPPLSLSPDQVMFDGRAWSPNDAWQDRDFWFPSSWSALKQAVAENVLEIGAHGMTHTPWPWLSAEGRTAEVGGTRLRLEAEFGRPVNFCSYPHGMHDATTDEHVSRVYQGAFTNESETVTQRSLTAAMPRIHVPGERPVLMNAILRFKLTGRILRTLAMSVGRA